jgi:GT2 family glycosyltransferase
MKDMADHTSLKPNGTPSASLLRSHVHDEGESESKWGSEFADCGELAAYVLPVFQAQAELEDTLMSLAESTIPAVVFVVDDGSQPPMRVPETLAGPPVRLIRLSRNQGVVAAANVGLRAALSEGFTYIARIDAGDYSSPKRLARQIDYLSKHPNCMLVGCDTDVWDESGKYCFTITPPRNPRQLACALHERAWLLGPTVMFRSIVFREVGLFIDRFDAAEDYEMFLRIAKKHEIGVVAEPLVTYVVREGSISSRKMRVQAISRLRIQIFHFQWSNWISYYGALRTVGTLLIPRWLKRALKLRFLYSRTSSMSSGESYKMQFGVRPRT